MNVYNTMPGVADMGMVWMGAGQPSSDVPMGLDSGEHSDMLLDPDNMYFTPSHHSISNQSIDDMHAVHNSHMEHMDNYDMMHLMDMKNESNDSSYVEDENSHPIYMITTSTQTLPCPTRKIKPIKHPGLVLKTPIAYQSNTDPSVIPIQKDGMAVCEKCGAIGVKHAFYTRERRFCSMACARGYSGLIPEPLPQSNQNTPDNKQHYAKYRFTMKMEDDFTDAYLDHPFPQLSPLPELPPIDDSLPLIRRKPSELANSFDWDSQLENQYFIAAPVTCFKHAPMADIWENIMVGMKVEVENTDCDNVSEAFPDSFWVATVMRIVGYKAQLRYEGFGSNNSKDFWVSLCSNQVHPVGWCATRGKPLIPPKTVEDKYSDWKDFLRKRLTGARTLPSNFSNKASDSLKSRFECGLNLEVVDKNRISQVKVAIVHKIIGKRLNVKYYDMPPEDAGFWCHEDSPLLHPVGWAKKVNHHLVAPINYLERVNQGIFDEDDATEELFTPFQIGSMEHTHSGFCVGMKLEAIDPLNLSSICVATVMDVLNYGYIMIRIDTYDSDATGADWFCYHVKSPCIFPVGFCERNHIPLTPPKGYDQATFNWRAYLMQTNNRPADPLLFNTFVPPHGFVTSMKIEAADLMDPRLVCIATIAKVVGRLLKVHFDGWEEEYDQWLDCESPDIYPVGWCQSVGHKLEGPPISAKPAAQIMKSPKVKKKQRKKKVKDNPPKTQSAATSTTNLKQPKVEIKVEEPTMSTFIDDNLTVTSDETNEEHQGPEAGQEPAGPDQSMPVSSEVVDPPAERKATSYVIGTNNPNPKVIPRLADASVGNCETGDLCPSDWNVFDVAQFLRVNDCANYCDSFSKQRVDGKMLLNLSKEDVLDITGGKVGPSLKIYDLVQQLKIKVNPAQVRHMKTNIKKFL
ncbi:scm-related gene containing four mbt domains isoform X1 [Leptinotarsa decemlineata]|uniref:scm-related gene containing four mbt domains isoform X1 n=3 Tax=Leptinotarsa decemlineata TaxID=7539 RepID=UPI000C255B74|nr:polycomb protein Sfmbt isoform X1 [Leptinotarsa decemlineata]